MLRNRTIFRLMLVLLLLVVGVVPLSAQADGPFRVAAVAPSATNDLAFSQSMYDALTLIQEEMGEDNFQFTFQDGTFIVDDAAVALREWAASGEYDLVIAHGSQYGAILEELAPEFPEIAFAWGTDQNTFGLDNVFAYTAAAQEGGYINGAIAAQLTSAGNIGVVGPIEVGDAKLYVDGFVAGVTATDPAVEVNVTYIQSFSDVPLATEAAQAFIANGADILTGTAQMVVGPIAVAKDADSEVLWFGTQSSQAELAGEIGVTFQVYRWDVVLADIIASIQGGTLGGQAYIINLENGGLEIVISEVRYPEGSDERAEIEVLVEELKAGIISGDIVIFPDDDMAEPVATEEADS
jgi:basic membrane lipoprotein Med (substrate-binding protein (PBP1-ABC) superfamily)